MTHRHASAHRRLWLVRDFHSGGHLELFLVSAVASVLAIRFYLRLTGYPQIGGGTLHIAHMLWGGLLMMAAIILMLAYLGRATRRWGALLGGVGFGTFIDEVGKFVTRDHDYFYRPAIALMYVVFVGAYLVIRAVRSRAAGRPEEYVVNALHELEEAALHDLQRDEQERALRLLERVRPPTPLSAGLARLIEAGEVAPPAAPSAIERAGTALLRWYRVVATRPTFGRVLVIFFVAQLAVKLLHVGLLVVRPDSGESAAARLALMSRTIDGYALAEWLQVGSSLISAAFVARGIAVLRRSRQAALRNFERSILVSVFLTQVFMFYRAQWEALVVLGFNLLVLIALGYMRAHDQEPANGGTGRGGQV